MDILLSIKLYMLILNIEYRIYMVLFYLNKIYKNYLFILHMF